jgi:hypothetical protein
MRLIAAVVWLSALLFASLAHSASVAASNSSQSPYPNGNDQFVLAPVNVPFTTSNGILLANLTLNAVWNANLYALPTTNISPQVTADQTPSNDLSGTPVIVDSNTVSKLNSANIAVIQCDQSAFPGYITPIDLLNQVAATVPLAIILYSNTSNFCQLTTDGTGLAKSIIFTMTTPSAYMVLGLSNSAGAGNSVFSIERRSAAQTNSTGSSGGAGGGVGGGASSTTQPGGPSPSTAVAMIILYSITGVITALFLVIIITGAVRAHRHPERYGPRNVLGRPRQSRARGLARAMLDTLPIVKFGEKDETVKPGDVELATASATGDNVVREMADGTATGEHTTDTVSHGKEPEASDGVEGESTDIKAAGAVATQKTHVPPAHAVDEDNSLGCSICTEDFERGQDVRVLPCNHSFHPACIDPWLLNVSGTCPLWYVNPLACFMFPS